jgi:hypothetical protein
MTCTCGAVGPFLSYVTVRRRSLPRFSCVANGAVGPFALLVTRRRRSLLRFSCVAKPPSVPSLRSSQDGVAHCFASLALQTACACNAVGSFALLITRRRRSLLCFSCVAYRVCPWRRGSLRFARHKTASLIASPPLHCKQRVPVAPSAPSLRSSHDGVAHRSASLALHTACACGSVGPFALLVTRRRRSLLRFSCVAKPPSVPSLRSSQDGVAHCFASLALQTACACGTVGPFASLVT